MQCTDAIVAGIQRSEHLCRKCYRTVSAYCSRFSHHHTVVVAAFVSGGAIEFVGLRLSCIVAYEHLAFEDGDTASDEVVIAGDTVCAFAFLD